MLKLIAKIATSGAKITIHFIAPVKKNAINAGLELIKKLTTIDVITASAMCPYTRFIALTTSPVDFQASVLIYISFRLTFLNNFVCKAIVYCFLC
jgi:hypothetical protein